MLVSGHKNAVTTINVKQSQVGNEHNYSVKINSGNTEGQARKK